MNPAENRLYLCAPVNALAEGLFEENIPLTEVRKHGDFGLGTFDQLDGEMVLLDGTFYQITVDGRVSVASGTGATPFACVTFFHPLTHDDLEGERSHRSFFAWLQDLLPSPNQCYALRIEGRFARIRARSVPKQESYRPLVKVAGGQSIFHFEQVEGILAGFYTPSFLSSLNVPGLHLHFISADRQQGGHLLECRPLKIRASVQILHTLELSLPLSLSYLTWDFQRDTARDLEKIEK